MPADALRPGITAEQALARYREGRDPADLATLFDLTSADLFRVALHVCPDPASAEDALQETFLAVMRHADRYEPGRPARPWLAAILRHHASRARRAARRVPVPARLLPQAAPSDPLLDSATAEEMERMRDALERLPEPYRGVALLRWRYGLEPAQIAHVKGVAPGTVGSWLHRAVRRMREELGALPSLLLAFRDVRGLEGIREALLRRAASGPVVSPVTSTVFTTGGVPMAVKVGVVATLLAAAAVAWSLHGCGGEDEKPSTPTPPADARAQPPAPSAPPTVPPPPPSAPPEGTKSIPVAPSPPTVPAEPEARDGGAYDPASATAVLRVKATLDGVPPAMRPIKFEADPECHRAHKDAVYNESIVARDGKLANVIAWVSKGTEGRTYATPSTPVVLDQKGCMYVPHVFTVQVKQPITIRNDDPTMHNVHGVPARAGNSEFNQSQPAGAAEIRAQFDRPEVAVRIKCDVHGWMESWAGVFAHPFHGVTGSDGAVDLKVPPGEYEVQTWQESPRLAAPQPVRVSVGKGETKEVDFVFKVK